MIQTLTSLGTFCPRVDCEYLDLPKCPHLGETGHCQIVVPPQVQPVSLAPPKRKR